MQSFFFVLGCVPSVDYFSESKSLMTKAIDAKETSFLQRVRNSNINLTILFFGTLLHFKY